MAAAIVPARRPHFRATHEQREARADASRDVALGFAVAAVWMVLLVATHFSAIVVALGFLVALAVLKCGPGRNPSAAALHSFVG
jgi:hypothetical protein